MKTQEITIKIDAELARQLEFVQDYTNQDFKTVIEQGVSLYYQQLQPHCQVRIALDPKYDLVGAASTNTN